MNEFYKNCKFPKPQMKKKTKEIVNDKTYYKVWNSCAGHCVLCGTSQKLELHHVLGRGKGLTNDARYCVMLCNNCHQNVVHKNQKKYRPMLLSICDKIYRKWGAK